MANEQSHSEKFGEQKNTTSIEDNPPEQKSDEFNWSAFAVAVSFVLLIVSLSLIFYSFNLSSTISQKENIIISQETQITELKTELHHKEEMLSILEAREVTLVMMAGLDINPDGYGKIIWDPEKQQALLQVSDLPVVPKGKDYQLWLIKNNKLVSAGVFAVNNKGDKFFKIEEIPDVPKQLATAFAITMEPKGGMPQPTGELYLKGTVKN